MKERKVGTVSRGIRCPIFREGDDLAAIVTDTVIEAAECEGFELRDKDVISITESVVARVQGNYVSVDDIAADVKAKLGGGTVGVIFPILSRNRFAICLRGIAKGCKKIVLMLSYPSDEVGNHLVTMDAIDNSGVNPYSDVLSLEKYRELFGHEKHEFTGVDYVEYYGDLIKGCGAEVEIIFANQAKAILPYADHIINCDIHTRARTKRILLENGAKVVCSLDDLMTAPINGSGCNEKYGLLGSNKSTEDSVKLFPRECRDLVFDIQARIFEKTGKKVEVMESPGECDSIQMDVHLRRHAGMYSGRQNKPRILNENLFVKTRPDYLTGIRARQGKAMAHGQGLYHLTALLLIRGNHKKDTLIHRCGTIGCQQ